MSWKTDSWTFREYETHRSYTQYHLWGHITLIYFYSRAAWEGRIFHKGRTHVLSPWGGYDIRRVVGNLEKIIKELGIP